MSLIEFWLRYYFHSHPLDLEVLVERVLQRIRPDLVVESRGGSRGYGDAGRDVVIKRSRSTPDVCGVVQVSAQENWRRKFRHELRSLVARSSAGSKDTPPTWIFATVLPVHERIAAPGMRPGDKDDELRWAAEFLANRGITMDVEIWGLRDFAAVIADGNRGSPIQAEFGFPQADLDSLKDIADTFEAFTCSSLRGVSQEIAGLGQLPRPEAHLLTTTIDNQGAVLLVGEGGSGKSALLAGLALTAQETGYCVLALRASSFSPTEGIQAIQDRLAIRDSVLIAIRRVAAVIPVLLIVDQLDTAYGTPLFDALLGFVGSVREMNNVRVAVGCRTWQAEKQPELGRLGLPKVESQPVTPSHAEQLLETLGVRETSSTLIELSTNLLNLSLIADLAATGEDVSTVSGAADLWHRYRRSVESREGNAALEMAVQLARYGLTTGTRELLPPGDESVQRLLGRGVLVKARGELIRFRHEEIQDYLYAWDAALRRLLDGGTVRSEIGDRMSRPALRWMFVMYLTEFPEHASAMIRDVIGGEDWPFYTKADLLDVLASGSPPASDLIDRLAEVLRTKSLADYVFRNLQRAEWFIPLRDRGLFDDPPRLAVVERGRQVVPWPAGEYIERIARVYPREIIAMANAVHTDNPPVYKHFMDAACRMDAKDAMDLVPVVERWMDEVEIEWLLPHDARELAIHLIRQGEWAAGLRLTQALLAPEARRLTSESTAVEVVPKRNRHDFDETLRLVIPELAALRPGATLSFIEKLLRAAMRMTTRGDDAWSLFRETVEDEDDNRHFYGYEDRIFSALRDTLGRMESSQSAAAKRVTLRYLRSTSSVFRRLSLHHMRLHLPHYRGEAVAALADPRNFFDSWVYHEYYRLLEAAYPKLGERDRRKILQCFDVPYPNRKRLTQDEQRHYEKRHEWRLLHAIRGHLDGEFFDRHKSLVDEFGQPEHPDRLTSMSVGWVGTRSPLESSEIIQMGPAKFLEFFSSWQPSGDFLGDTREGLAKELEAAATDSPEVFARECRVFRTIELQGVFAYHLLQGFRNALRAERLFSLGPVVDLCAFLVVLEDADLDEPHDDYGFRLAWLKGAIAHFVEEAVRKDERGADPSSADAIISILRRLFRERQSAGVTESDCVTVRINSTRGQALDALISFALWRGRHLSRQDPPPESRLEEHTRQLLDLEVDPAIEPEASVHSAFGQFISNLYWLDSEWVRSRWKLIFPQSSRHQSHWDAALLGQVGYGGRCTRDLYDLLRYEYRRAFTEPPDFNEERKTTSEKLGDRLALAFWWGWEPIDGDDSLIELLFSSGPEAGRHSFLWTIGRALRDDPTEAASQRWQDLRRFWGTCIQHLPGNSNSSNGAGQFAWWLRAIPEPLASCHELVRSTIQNLSQDHHVGDIVEYLSREAPNAPTEAVLLLDELAHRSELSPYIHMRHDNVRSVLQTALQGPAEAQDRAVAVINYFGERGVHRYRDLLE